MANDPELLCTIPGINAYQLENGTERLVTVNGPQNLSIWLVPNSGVSANASSTKAPSSLRFQILPDLDITVPSTARIFNRFPQSYLIPHQDSSDDAGSFTRLEFSQLAQEKGLQEHLNTFENILSQHTAHAGPIQMAVYDPSTYKAAAPSTPGSSKHDGKLFLVDERNGSIIGELGSGHQVVEDSQMKTNTQDPVEITLPSSSSGKINVTPASQSYLELAKHPAYQKSTLVSGASTASRLIVNTSGYVCKTLQSQADSYVQKSKPNAKPLTFEPATHERIRKFRTLTEGAASLSAKTVGQVQRYAQNLGATVAKNDKVHVKGGGLGPNGKPIEGYKPGIFNKGVVAFSTIADGIDQAGRNILSGTGSAATTVVGHKYGAQAGEITKNISTGVKNVGLIYIDATGVTRKAIIKSVVKGMVVGKMSGGTDIIADGNGGYQLGKQPSSTSVPSTFTPNTSSQRVNELPKSNNSNKTQAKYASDLPPTYAASITSTTSSTLAPEKRTTKT